VTGSVATRPGSRPLPIFEAEEPASTSYDELPDAVLVLDGGGRLLSANIAAANLLRLDLPAVLGRPLGEVLVLLDERGNDWWECSKGLLRLPGVRRQPERRLMLADPSGMNGGDRELLATVQYIREQGAVIRLVVCLRDTASRRRLERSRADLVSTVAHELRSPLTSVKGFTATLLAKWDRFTDEQKQLMLATVNADADRVTRLLTELLDVSRIDAGRLELRRQVVDVCAAVRKVVAGHIASGEPESRFVVHPTDGLPEMWLDPDKIDQVLANLVENALRHGRGTVTVEVRRVTMERPDSSDNGAADNTASENGEASGEAVGAEVIISDEGEGIPEETLARIFTKFWRGGSRRGGTGLGLYIVKGIVEAHGGTIVAGRSPGGGAQFRFTLPAGTPTFA
jgi:signal transduction histidine kinase